MRIAVGCPVSSRGWILPAWFTFVGQACHLAEVDPVFVFAGSRERDRDSFDVIDAFAKKNLVLVTDTAETPRTDKRDWGKPGRLQHMAMVRNQLLGLVRDLEPAYFLSVDSDILLHPWWLKAALEGIGDYDALGGKTYMTKKGLSCPSWANLTRENNLRRQEATGLFRVDVIMAIKLLTPAAYAVNYRVHPLGEDVGWSIQARKAGLKLAWYGDCASKHVMEPGMLEPIDERVGY
jgi:hypothetical protein